MAVVEAIRDQWVIIAAAIAVVIVFAWLFVSRRSNSDRRPRGR
jgi:hypothetical protein